MNNHTIGEEQPTNRKKINYMKKPKIELYAVRSFSNKLAVTFDFIAETKKPMFLFLTYLLLPLALIQGKTLNSLLGQSGLMMNTAEIENAPYDYVMSIIGYTFINLITIFLAIAFISAVVNGLIRIYMEQPERLAGLTFSEFRPTLWRGIKRSMAMELTIMAVFILVCAVFGGLIAMMGDGMIWGIVLLYVAVLICVYPLQLALPVYLFEDITIGKTMSRTFRLGFRTWAGIFGVTFILALISYIVAGVCSIPLYIMSGIQIFMNVQGNLDNGITNSFLYSTGMYVFAVIQVFGMLLSYALFMTGGTFLYGHAAEKIDGVSVRRDVDRFEELTDTSADDSRLFGTKDDIDNFESI